MRHASIIFALLAAILFGGSIPLAKFFVGNLNFFMLAGLLYFGSGLGLFLFRLARDKTWKPSGLQHREWRWLFGAIFFGGIVGPLGLVYGLATVSGAVASLMLNLESVFTALLAWIVFKENANKRVVLGMVFIVLGGVVLSWQPGASDGSSPLGLFAITLAGLCWAIDNNLTRKVSAADALFIACSKGVLAGVVNCTIGVTIGEQLPELNIILSAMTLGLFGFGISLVLFVLALRGLGAARTGAYFSTAPFIGSAVAILTLGESVEVSFWIASVLMLIGVWLHLTEVHDHMHTHEPLEHEHFHNHDEHHQHKHESHEILEKPHSHLHRHDGITHQHPHFPDIHHQHSHYLSKKSGSL